MPSYKNKQPTKTQRTLFGENKNSSSKQIIKPSRQKLVLNTNTEIVNKILNSQEYIPSECAVSIYSSILVFRYVLYTPIYQTVKVKPILLVFR